MTYEPARTPVRGHQIDRSRRQRRPRGITKTLQPHYGTTKLFSPRRRRVLLGAVLALLLAAAAFATPRRLPTNDDRTYLSPDGWPRRGQAAFVLGNSRPALSPHEHPAPIASLAKVMTAYLTLKRYPLNGAQDGFTVTITPGEAQTQAQEAAQGQSVVAVRAGEQLTERELLEALLIPSGNNIARMLAHRVAGSEKRFLGEMNAEARALGMSHTIYTDPSGFDPSTVSTAADQLRVFQEAMRFPVFRQIISMPRVTLPVAGTLTNYNPLIAKDYPGKTGSDSAAKGCLAFFTHVTVGGRRRLTAVGVVMGQGEGSDTSTLLAAAAQAAEQLIGSAKMLRPRYDEVGSRAPHLRPLARLVRQRNAEALIPLHSHDATPPIPTEEPVRAVKRQSRRLLNRRAEPAVSCRDDAVVSSMRKSCARPLPKRQARARLGSDDPIDR